MKPDRALFVLAVIGLVLLSVAASFHEIWAVDFFWQYATGRLVAAQGFPSGDVFSYTASGAPWIELRWLFCLVQATVMDAVGPVGVQVLVWLAVLTAFTLVTLPVVERRTLAFVGPVVAVALLTASLRFLPRPELVSFVLLGAFLLVLDRNRRRPTRWLWALPLLQVVWVNSHTVFVLGPLVVTLALLAEGFRAVFGGADPAAPPDPGARPLPTLALLLLATLAACLVNPWGLDGALFPLRLYEQIRGTAFKRAIQEFNGPFQVGGAFAAFDYYRVLIAIAVASALLNARRLDPFWSLVCLSQLYLSVLAIRNLPLFALAAVPFVLSNFARSPLLTADEPGPWRRRIERGVAVGAIVLCAFATFQLVTNRFHVARQGSLRFGLGVAEHRFPTRAVDFLEREGVRGRVFSTMLESSYLTSRGIPVFLDPRLEVFGEERFVEYLSIEQDERAWRSAVERFGLEVLMVGLQAKLAETARADPRWGLVHFDTTTAVFLRDDQAPHVVRLHDPAAFARTLAVAVATLPELGPAKAEWYASAPNAEPHLALVDFLLLYHRPEEAAPLLAQLERAVPELPGLALRRITLYEQRDDWGTVIRLAGEALEAEPDDARLQLKLGRAYYHTRDIEGARTWLERSLVGLPDRASTWGLLGSVQTAQGRLDEAARSFARAVELSPEEVQFVTGLARVRAKQGRLTEAVVGLEAAHRATPDDVTVIRDLALLYARIGDRARARAWLERGLALAPFDERLRWLESEISSGRPTPAR